MKVLYLTNQYPKISHTFVRREIEAVEAAGVQVVRCTVRAPGETYVDPRDVEEARRTHVLLARGAVGLLPAALATLATRPGLTLRALAAALVMARRSPRGPLVHLAYLAEACALRRLCEREGVAHVHVHFATNPADVALLCGVLGGPPFSFTAHGTSDLGGAWATTLPAKLGRAAFAVAVSEDGRRRLLADAPPGAEAKVHVVRCGVDAAFLQGDPPGVPDAPRLLAVGRLSPEKGLGTLLDAAARLARDEVPFELALAGDGPERPALQAQAERLGLAGRVRFLGWCSGEQVRRELLASRALVLSSASEGLPVVLMEALALRRPVVATSVGGIPELVEPGTTGWLVPPGDAVALADALRDMLSRPAEQLDALGARGRQAVAARHDATASGRRMAQLLADPRARGSAPDPSAAIPRSAQRH